MSSLVKFAMMIVFINILLLVNTMAGVNLKNGNFYIAFTDIVVPGAGPMLKFTRTNNTRVAYNGSNGIGWGNDFDTFLKNSADGSIVIHEYGSGARTRFTPEKAVDPEAAAQKIVDAMRKRQTYTAAVIKKLVEKLSKNQEVRHAYAREYGVEVTLAEGTILYSNTRGIQELHVTKDGYERKYNDGRIEYFNKDGKLAKSKDSKTGYTLTMNYGKDGYLESVKDSHAKQLFFSWYSTGKIKSIWSVGDKKATYKYKGDDLIETTDVGGHHYRYTYDANHCMTSITYSDNTKMTMEYDKQTQFITKITDRDRKTTEYKYGSDPKNPDMHYWTLVTKEGFDGKPVTNRYEYEIKKRPDGSHYTYSIIAEINKIKTETIYNECCSLPVKIARGKHVTNFKYNPDGLLVQKTSTKGDFIKIDYNMDLKKISKVVDKQGWTEFDYDKKGNLVKAKNSHGKSVLLIYDNKGRITTMVDKRNNKTNKLAFSYNALGKPSEITMEKAGSIKVLYDNYGEIKRVESPTGHKMAVQVHNTFRDLLAIVKPAGVDLNM